MEFILGFIIGFVVTAAYQHKDKLVAYIKAKLDRATMNK